MAHIRAVGQIVGAELTCKELKQEGGFISRFARGVEGGFVGRSKITEFRGEKIYSGIPGDWLVVRRALMLYHGFGKTTLLIQPVVGTSRQVRNRVFPKEIASNSLVREFVRDGLCSVFTKLEDFPLLVRTRPGAALAIESFFVINVDQCARSPNRPHFAKSITCGIQHRMNARRLLISSANPGSIELYRIL